MAKKKGKSRDAPATKPKSLRKQSRKAQADLDKAVAKRDKAQARVDALGIIADEIRAQLADLEKAKAAAAASEAKSTKASPPKTSPKTTSSAKARPRRSTPKTPPTES